MTGDTVGLDDDDVIALGHWDLAVLNAHGLCYSPKTSRPFPPTFGSGTESQSIA